MAIAVRRDGARRARSLESAKRSQRSQRGRARPAVAARALGGQMSLRVVGAGLGRTGTNSLKVALEDLLGGRCYHMYEAAKRDADTPHWERAAQGQPVDWDGLLGEYVATVDWPACAFWRELHEANPHAWVLLSTRVSAQEWWQSMAQTIVPRLDEPVPAADPETARRRTMVRSLLARRFTPRWRERDAAIAAYERHNEQVRRGVPSERLIEWRPSDGWAPICSALGLALPARPFPHLNATAAFRAAQSSTAEDEVA